MPLVFIHYKAKNIKTLMRLGIAEQEKARKQVGDDSWG